ncbi:hypothetical protein V5799_012757 [Amblyomma americanum]|uniref:Uncharacterized protein n=1 Tax=Amblyomma americanum TaxID=6943 RepID=A0AAQ4E7R4_AMBAM
MSSSRSAAPKIPRWNPVSLHSRSCIRFDHVESRQKEIINLFKCIMARASAELQDQLKELKPKLYCTDYYIVVKKVCRLKPFVSKHIWKQMCSAENIKA